MTLDDIVLAAHDATLLRLAFSNESGEILTMELRGQAIRRFAQEFQELAQREAQYVDKLQALGFKEV